MMQSIELSPKHIAFEAHRFDTGSLHLGRYCCPLDVIERKLRVSIGL
jgi:hypothetical protein